MKNSYFEANVAGVARYLSERKNEFLVAVEVDEQFSYVEFENQDNANLCILDRNISKPIGYYINVFPREENVRIVIPERTYGFMLKNSKYDREIPMKFTIEQTEGILLEIPFADYCSRMTDIDDLIDDVIKEQLQSDIERIFNPGPLDEPILDNYEKKWFLKAEEVPTVHFKKLYAFE